MAYSELIKNFEKIRNYLRQFYVYGFRTRDEYNAKSARSYDNEKRRIESWLGEYMTFRNETSGKISFISVDGQRISHNPLYNAFKAKSFTGNDIVLHFYILDILHEGEFSVTEITDLIADEYMPEFDEPLTIDESTVRKKLKEYEGLGIVKSRKDGKKILYSRNDSRLNLEQWKDAIGFYSEQNPAGIIGSFILDKYEDAPDFFSFRQHYLLYALESDIQHTALKAISEDRKVTVRTNNRRHTRSYVHTVTPLKIFVSTQTGRKYLLAYGTKHRDFSLFRLDYIEEICIDEPADNKARIAEKADDILKYVWGTSTGNQQSLDHLEMVLCADDCKENLLKRLDREKRGGTVTETEDGNIRFETDVYDANEMIPWIRSFIGQIVSIKCSNKAVEELFWDDTEKMFEMYEVIGEEVNAVQ